MICAALSVLVTQETLGQPPLTMRWVAAMGRGSLTPLKVLCPVEQSILL